MGIIDRKLRDKERRIQEILDAARSLFMTKGYINTTMLDIAEKSELSRRTLYLYFKSKEELSYRVMLEAFDSLYKLIEEAVGKTEGPGIRKLEAIRDAFLEFYRNRFDQFFFTLFFDFKINTQDIRDEDARECYRVLKEMVELVAGVIDEGIEDGSVKAFGDGRRIAVTAITMIQGTMQKISTRKDWVRTSFNVGDEEIIEEMFSIFFFAIRA